LSEFSFEGDVAGFVLRLALLLLLRSLTLEYKIGEVLRVGFLIFGESSNSAFAAFNAFADLALLLSIKPYIHLFL
jgi:hypothetical protein